MIVDRHPTKKRRSIGAHVPQMSGHAHRRGSLKCPRTRPKRSRADSGRKGGELNSVARRRNNSITLLTPNGDIKVRGAGVWI